MTSPTIESIASQVTSTGTTVGVSLPATVNANDCLIIVGRAVVTINTFPSGWTTLYNVLASGFRIFACAINATGTEGGGSASFVLGSSGALRVHVVRISNWYADASAGIAQSHTTTSTGGTSPDPPSLTPSWGGADNIWIAHGVKSNPGTTVNSYPSNYINGDNSGLLEFIATRALNASSEDPGIFNLDGNFNWMAATIAVRPAASGAGGIPAPLLFSGKAVL